MRKKITVIVALAVLPLFLLGIMLFVLLTASGAAEPIGQLATPETCLRYAAVCAKLGAPWDIALMTDAMRAYDAHRGDIEDVNPLHTALEYTVLTVTEENKIVYREDNAQEVTIWAAVGSATYEGEAKILGYAQVSDAEAEEMDGEALAARIQEYTEARCTDEVRYIAELSPNLDFAAVLRRSGMPEQTQKDVLALYEADYIYARLDEDTQRQVGSILAMEGMYQYVDPTDYVSCEGVVFTGGARDVVYFSQLDPRWADELYGIDKIATHGCGPTAMSIVVSSLSGVTSDPRYMARWAYDNGYYAKHSGSYHGLIEAVAKNYDLPCTSLTTPQEIVDVLERGGLVVALMGPGHFTSSGHFIVLRGVTEDGKVLVADPASYERSQQTWELSTIVNERLASAGAGGPFWGIEERKLP